jgi:hypothetical protein
MDRGRTTIPMLQSQPLNDPIIGRKIELLVLVE